MKYVNPATFGRLDPSLWRDYPEHFTASIWPEKLPSKPADYGSNDFHGRTHPDIIKTALARYTKPGELVWDCFGGSGTTIDVCEEYGNPCIANDINGDQRTTVRYPSTEIIKADSTIWHPGKLVQLVICHPPYMDIINYGDGKLSTPDINQWAEYMCLVVENINKVLQQHRVLVVIVGTVWKDNQLYCLDYEMMSMPGIMGNYRLLGRVIRPFGETKGGNTSGKKNQNLWRYRRLKYGIWELGQDIVLWLQRIR